MLFDRLRRFTKKVFDFHAKNGFYFTFLEIRHRIWILISGRFSYNKVKKEFPGKFASGRRSWFSPRNRFDELESLVAAELQLLVDALEIEGDSKHILSEVRATCGTNAYYRMVANLFAIENQRKLFEGRGKIPLLHMSHLPDTLPIKGKRILFVTSQFPDPRHGGGNRVLNFLKFLSEENEIYLATSYLPQEDREVSKELQPYCRSILKIPRQIFGGNHAEILKWLAGKRMDFVHYEWPLSLRNFDRAYGRYHIFTYMEGVALRVLMDMRFMQPFSRAWVEKIPDLLDALRLELVDAARLDARIAVTNKDGEFLRSLFPQQEYAVLNHGVTFDEFVQEDVEPESYTMVYVGNFAHYPNVDAVHYFFEAIWEGILERVPDVKIYLVGTNPTQDVVHLHNGKNVFVTGEVPDVRPYIQKASVCIAPLKKGAGLRGKVVEYAALRRTFVATSLATSDLTFRDGVDYYCADTPEIFIEKTVKLLRDNNLSRQMGNRSFETACRLYDTRRLAGFLCRFYATLESRL